MNNVNFRNSLITVSTEEYARHLERHGLKVADDNLRLTISGLVDLSLPVAIFSGPELKELKELSKLLESEFADHLEKLEESEILEDLGELSKLLSGERRKQLGKRVFSHSKIEYRGTQIRVIKYYKYIELRVPASVSSDAWEKLAMVMTCVAATLGTLVLLGLIKSGISAAGLALLVPAVMGSCGLLVEGISKEDQEAARIVTYTGR